MAVIYEPSGAAREYAALACNLYTGCGHGCKYCYAPSCLRKSKEDFAADTEPRKDIVKKVAREAPKHANGERVLLCFACDPYQPSEMTHGVTREALKLFVHHDVRFEILTKGGLRAVRDFDLLERGDGVFATTLLFTDDDDRVEWEPNAATLSERIEAIGQAWERGIPTWVSIEPVIKAGQALEVIQMLDPWVDEWKIGKWNHDKRAHAIDWETFVRSAIDILAETDTNYMLKDALHPYLPQGAATERYQISQSETTQITS